MAKLLRFTENARMKRHSAPGAMNTNVKRDGSQDGVSGLGLEYGSGSEETAALLCRTSPPPVVVSSTSQSKPVLTRQDRTTFLVASPQPSVSGLGGSEESGTAEGARSVPDIELQCSLDGDLPVGLTPTPTPAVAVPMMQPHYRSRQSHQYNRCRCDRRDSLMPTSALHLARSVSR